MKSFVVEKIHAPVTKNAQVYERLKNALLYARFRPGEVLSIRALANSLGTSTMPVREAATRLTAERALEALPNRGLRVPVLTPQQSSDIFRVRVALEGMAAELAANVITPKELAELEKLELKLERAVRANQRAQAVQANIEFHLALYRTSGSETLVSLIEALYLRFAPRLYLVFEQLPGPLAQQTQFVHAHHRAILDALQSRDPAAARAALGDDLLDVLDVEQRLDEEPRSRSLQKGLARPAGRPRKSSAVDDVKTGPS